ncbi:MAG: zinc-ribbon domain-containing protein [Deltaproteobacteria bacterium]|nr:zinc-ribbon domain-containing protein [Deltaproteobacteria bacterium]
MLIECPSCHHSGEVDGGGLPYGLLKARCPRCGHGFTFTRRNDAPRHPLHGGMASALGDAPAKNTATPPPAAPPPRPDKPAGGGAARSLAFHGTGSALLGIYAVNMLLSVITLNIYYFWGKVKLRKYLYGQMELMGERFNYLGTGKELFRGAFKAGAIFFAAFIVPNLLSRFVNPAFGFLVFVNMFLLRPFILVAARRYRMSRTEWHGVRFSFRGTVAEGMKLYISGGFLSVITLGFYYPRHYIAKQAFWRENSFYGSAAFKYDGESKDVFRRMIIGMLLMPATFGIYWFWYRAQLMRYDWGHTSIQSVRFSSSITGGQLFGYHLVNLLIVVFTLGIGYPWFVKRKTEFWTRYVAMTGEFDFDRIRQAPSDAKASGDDLADMLDIDFAF